MCYRNLLLEELCHATLGEDLRSLHLVFSGLYPIYLFPFLILCPFAIINHSCKYNYMLSSVNPPSKSLNLAVVSVTYDTLPFCLQLITSTIKLCVDFMNYLRGILIHLFCTHWFWVCLKKRDQNEYSSEILGMWDQQGMLLFFRLYTIN